MRRQGAQKAWPLAGNLVAGLATFALAACGNSASGPGGPPVGQGPGFDYTFTADAQDVAAPTDSGPVKTDPDASVPVDAGAGTPDTTPIVDTAPDTGTPDSGGSADSGPVDTGVDSGPEDVAVDAGFVAVCGDNACTVGKEDCNSCPKDCGACPFCGDGKCAPGVEDCKTCPADCNACPQFCGDGTCDKAKEDCASCAADCGNCPTVCGNGKCEMPAESFDKCPKDCPPTGTCDPLTSNGCLAAQQCYPVSNKPVCANVGSLADGAACQLNTQCSKGYLCVGSKCKRICDHTGKNPLVGCPTGAICDKLVYNDGKDVGWNLGTCIKVDNCNLTTEVGCPPTDMCAISANGKICVKAGTGTSGASCKFANDCNKGFICIGNPGTCKPKCHLKGGSPKCAGGKQCNLVTIQEPGKPAKPAPDDLGVCG